MVLYQFVQLSVVSALCHAVPSEPSGMSNNWVLVLYHTALVLSRTRISTRFTPEGPLSLVVPLKAGVLSGFGVGALQFLHGGHQRLRNEPSPKKAEPAVLVRKGG